MRTYTDTVVLCTKNSYFFPRSNGVRRACLRRSGLPALALAAAARQIVHTTLALSICTTHLGRRSVRNVIPMVFFSVMRLNMINGTLCQLYNFMLAQAKKSSMQLLQQRSAVQTNVWQRRRKLSFCSKDALLSFSQVAMVMCSLTIIQVTACCVIHEYCMHMCVVRMQHVATTHAALPGFA